MKQNATRLLAAVLTTAVTAANAQTPADRYQIELLIVKHSNAESEQLEQAVNPELKHRLEQPALALFDTRSGDKIRLVRDPELFKLTGEAGKMRDSGLFEVVHHIAWQQPPYHRAQAQYINILKGPTKGLLKGIAWLSYERYFQLRLDFQYDAAFQETPQTIDSVENASLPVSIHIKKIMSADQLYYLDHPIIGVLAHISPATAEVQTIKVPKVRATTASETQ